MTLRSATKTFLTLTLALPIVQMMLFWVGALLASMGDEAGAQIIRHIGTICQVLWVLSLAGLVVTLALVVLSEPPRGDEQP
jgi:hypothetical protein